MQWISARHILRFCATKQAALYNAHAQCKQRKTHDSADQVTPLPLDVRTNDARRHRAGEPHRRNDGGANAALSGRQQFGNQGDPRAKFTGQPKPCNEPEYFVLPHIRYECVQNVGHRVKNDRPKQHFDAAEAVAKHSKCNATEKHSHQLNVEQALAHQGQLFWVGDPERLEAGDSDNGEQHQIKEVNEVSQRGHQHGQHGGARQLGTRVHTWGNF